MRGEGEEGRKNGLPVQYQVAIVSRRTRTLGVFHDKKEWNAVREKCQSQKDGNKKTVYWRITKTTQLREKEDSIQGKKMWVENDNQESEAVSTCSQ